MGDDELLAQIRQLHAGLSANAITVSAAGELPSVTIGRSRRVTDAALEQYLEQLTGEPAAVLSCSAVDNRFSSEA